MSILSMACRQQYRSSRRQQAKIRVPRSGTVTEIYDYLRLLYARIGIPHCPQCNRKITSQSSDSITDSVLKICSRRKEYNDTLSSNSVKERHI